MDRLASSTAFKVFFVIISYLLGSVCSGYIVAGALKKKDFGRKDLPGAAGSARQMGLAKGILVGFLDALKGMIPPLLGKALKLDLVTICIACLAVVIGHNWPVFFKFKGGGGLSTTIGMSIVLVPKEFIIAFPIAIIAGYIYKYTLGRRLRFHPNAVGGGVGTFLLPLLSFIFDEPLSVLILFTLVFLIVALKGIILFYLYNVKIAG
jgi:acyl-phosphate glycerol 3-phosphate acyltransferase